MQNETELKEAAWNMFSKLWTTLRSQRIGSILPLLSLQFPSKIKSYWALQEKVLVQCWMRSSEKTTSFFSLPPSQTCFSTTRNCKYIGLWIENHCEKSILQIILLLSICSNSSHFLNSLLKKLHKYVVFVFSSFLSFPKANIPNKYRHSCMDLGGSLSLWGIVFLFIQHYFLLK